MTAYSYATTPDAANAAALNSTAAPQMLWAQMPFAMPQPSQKQSIVPLVIAIVITAFLVIGGLVLLERLAPPDLQPSSVIGSAAGNIAYREMAEALAAEKAKAEALAEANSRMQREVLVVQGQIKQIEAAAQSQLAQEVESNKARAHIAVQSYSTLFERTALMYRTMSQIFTENNTLRNQLVSSQQGGRTGSIVLLDMISAFTQAAGNNEATSRLQSMRDQMQRASVSELEGAMGRAVPMPEVGAFAIGLPDPAAFQAALIDSSLAPRVQAAPAVVIEPRANPPSPIARN